MSDSVRVLQVSNISPNATKEQIQTLFSYIGRISECRVYPTDANQTQQKFAYVKFDRESAVEIGQHLTNTVFIDRALVCVPAASNTIPDEETALQSGPAMPGQRQLPPNVTNTVKADADGQEMLYTNDPTLSSLGLPQYPPLPKDTEPSKVEEIRRTVYIGNLEKGCDGEDLMKFLSATIGEVMYLRMTAGNEYLPCAYAYVEFSNQASIPIAIQNSGLLEYNGRPLKIQHSRVAIIKPKRKTADQALEEVEEAIRINESRGDASLLSSRSFSPSDRENTGVRRRRSPSTSRRRSPSPPPRRRTPSPPRRSRSRKRSRSRDADRRRRSDSRSPESKKKKKKRSRSKERDATSSSSSRKHKRSRSRERDHRRR